MKITQQNESCTIECIYDSQEDRENFKLTIPTGRCGAVIVNINLYLLDELIDTLQNFRSVIKIATGK